ERCADDPVLLGLDRGDDVLHLPGAAGVQAGQQGGLSGKAEVAALVGGVQVEHLVLVVHDLPPLGVQVAASPHPVPGCGGGQVERAGGRGAPVDQQRLVVVLLVEQPD